MTARRAPTKAQIQDAARDPRFIDALWTRNHPNHKWSDDAACRGRDPELFFPDPADNATYPLLICADCPVQAWCLADAIVTNAGHGIRNSTEKERTAMSLAWSQALPPVAEPPVAEEPQLEPCLEGHGGMRNDRTGRPYCPTCKSAAARQGNAKRWSVAS